MEDRPRTLIRRALRILGERQVQGVAERVAPAHRVHRHHQVLLDGHRAPELQVLEGPRDAEPRTQVRRRVGQRPRVEIDRPAVGPHHAGDAVEHRRLACAVGADQAEDLAAVQVERDAVEGDDASEADGHITDAQHRHATFTFLVPNALAVDHVCSALLRRSPHTPSGKTMSWMIRSTPTAIENQS